MCLLLTPDIGAARLPRAHTLKVPMEAAAAGAIIIITFSLVKHATLRHLYDQRPVTIILSTIYARRDLGRGHRAAHLATLKDIIKIFMIEDSIISCWPPAALRCGAQYLTVRRVPKQK